MRFVAVALVALLALPSCASARDAVPPKPALPDGLRHEVIAGLPSGRLSCLESDPDTDRMFVGSLDRGVAILDVRTRALLGTLDRTNGLPDDCVRSLLYDPAAGSLWVGGDQGVAVIAFGSGETRLAREIRPSGAPLAGVVTALARLGDEPAVLAGTANGVYRIPRDGEPRPAESPSAARLGRVHALKNFKDGLYACTDTGLYRTSDGTAFEPVAPEGAAAATMTTDLARRGPDATFWATPRGVGFDAGGGRGLLTVANGLPSDWVTAVDFDRTRASRSAGPETYTGLWVGTKTAGLALGEGTTFRVIDAASGGLSDDRVTDLLVTDAAVYVATDGGGLNRYAPKRRLPDDPYSAYEGFPGRITRLASRDGALFLATTAGIYRMRDLVLERYWSPDDRSLPFWEAPDLAFDDAGRLFALLVKPSLPGGKNVLVRLEPGPDKFLQLPGREGFPQKTELNRLANAPDEGMNLLLGRITASVTGQIARATPDRIAPLALPDGVSLAEVDRTPVVPYDRTWPLCGWFQGERAFIGLGPGEGLAAFEAGIWRITGGVEVGTVRDIVPLGGGRMAFATGSGIVLNDGGRWGVAKARDGSPGRATTEGLSVGALEPDPEIPDALYFGCIAPGGTGDSVEALLGYRSGDDLEFRPAAGEISDLEYVKPFLFIVAGGGLTFLQIVETPPGYGDRLIASGWRPGATLVVPKAMLPKTTPPLTTNIAPPPATNVAPR